MIKRENRVGIKLNAQPYSFGVNIETLDFSDFMAPISLRKFDQFKSKQVIEPPNAVSNAMKARMAQTKYDNKINVDLMKSTNVKYGNKAPELPKTFDGVVGQIEPIWTFKVKTPDQRNNFKGEAPNSIKVDMLELKVRQMEKQTNEDKQLLLDVINENIFNIKPRNNSNTQSILKNKESDIGIDNDRSMTTAYQTVRTFDYDNKSKTQIIPGLNVNETEMVVNEIKQLKQHLDKLIEYQESSSKLMRYEVANEMRMNQELLRAKFEQLENERRIQNNCVKFIMEKAGSRKLKAMSNNLLEECKI